MAVALFLVGIVDMGFIVHGVLTDPDWAQIARHVSCKETNALQNRQVCSESGGGGDGILLMSAM